jgi:hypothetical protein
VRDTKVEIPATRSEPTDRITLGFIYPHLRSSAFIGGQICFSSSRTRKSNPVLAADERR